MHIVSEIKSQAGETYQLPLFSSEVAAGFPSPADDYVEQKLSLDEYLIPHPSATYFARAAGDSMAGRGIHDGDLLVVDRSEPVLHNAIVVAAVNGELTCKVVDLQQHRLLAANQHYPAIPINDDDSLQVEGVVIHSIRHHKSIKYVKSS